MPAFRDIFVAVTIISAAVSFGIRVYAPQYVLSDSFSKSVFFIALINFSVYGLWTLFVYPFFFSPLRDLPGPKGGNLLWGHGPAAFSKPIGNEMLQWFNNVENPGLLRFRGFWNQDRLVPTSPETLKAVMSDKSYDFEKPARVRRFLVQVLGEGLILVEGAEHKFQRKHLLPAFQVKQIRDLYPTFWEKSRSLVDVLDQELTEGGPDKVIEFNDWATRVTLDIIGLAGFGRDFGALKNPDDELVQKYNTLLEPSREKALYFVLNIITWPWLIKMLPWKVNDDMKRISSELKQFTLNLVHERQRDFNEKKNTEATDILSLLVRSNDFKDTELGDQMLTFTAAGHETTSSALTWVVHLMAIHPEMQARLRAEIRENLPSLSEVPGPTPAEIEALPYLNAVCNETLRLYPTVPATVREAVRDTALPIKLPDGTTCLRPVPRGTPVHILPWAVNRSQALWGPNAERFVPDRWLGEGCANTGGQTSNYANITFLHGPRSCIGQGFAKAELKCLAAAVVGSFEIKMADPMERVYPSGVITTKPANGMHVKLTRLEGW